MSIKTELLEMKKKLEMPWPDAEVDEAVIPAWMIDLCDEAAKVLQKAHDELEMVSCVDSPSYFIRIITSILHDVAHCIPVDPYQLMYAIDSLPEDLKDHVMNSTADGSESRSSEIRDILKQLVDEGKITMDELEKYTEICTYVASLIIS